MKLWLRLVWALLSWRSRGPLELHQVGKRNFRVWPSDLDIFNHMNNGIYLTLLDLARFDTLKRSGSWAKAKRAKLHPVVVGETKTGLGRNCGEEEILDIHGIHLSIVRCRRTGDCTAIPRMEIIEVYK